MKLDDFLQSLDLGHSSLVPYPHKIEFLGIVENTVHAWVNCPFPVMSMDGRVVRCTELKRQ